MTVLICLGSLWGLTNVTVYTLDRFGCVINLLDQLVLFKNKDSIVQLHSKLAI
jgi:hypothetical protein